MTLIRLLIIRCFSTSSRGQSLRRFRLRRAEKIVSTFLSNVAIYRYLSLINDFNSLEISNNTSQLFYFYRSIGKKLSSLLYTNPEDDWSDLGLDGNDYDDSPDHPSSSSSQAPSSALSPTEQKMLLQKNNSNQLSSQYNKSISPSTINEDEEESVNVVNENNTNHNMNNKFDLGPKVQNWTEVIRNDAPKRTISSPMVTYTQKEADNSIGSSNGENAPQVRRKSSELSASMKTRLEAFNSSTQASGIPETEKSDAVKTTVEPDKTFHNKLQAFRKISEGNLHQQEVERKPKPPMTISSLLGGGVS